MRSTRQGQQSTLDPLFTAISSSRPLVICTKESHGDFLITLDEDESPSNNMFSAKTFTLALQSLALAAVASPLATRGADFCKTWTESSPDKAIGVFDVVLGQGYYIQAKVSSPTKRQLTM